MLDVVEVMLVGGIHLVLQLTKKREKIGENVKKNWTTVDDYKIKSVTFL